MTGQSSFVTLRRAEEKEFRLIYWASFAFFLVAAIGARLGLRERSPSAASRAPRRSVFGEARAAALTAIPFAFG